MTFRKAYPYDPLILGADPILLPPTTPPLICVQFHEMYRPLIIGALRSFLHEGVWNTDDDEDRDQAIANIHHLLQLFATGTCPEGGFVGCFIGEIKQYMGTQVPEGCLPLDGSDYAMTDYPELVDVLDDIFEWSFYIIDQPEPGRFRLPNLTGRTLVVAGDALKPNPYEDSVGGNQYPLGEPGGEERHTLTVNEMPSHNHRQNVSGTVSASGSGQVDVGRGTGNYSSSHQSENTGGDGSHNNMPPYFNVNFCIVATCQEVNVMPFRLRQNPDNPCLMEQSLDNGDSWIDAFDYSLCDAFGGQVSNQTYINNVMVIINNLTTIYDGTAGSIDPVLVYGDANDGLRDDALCTALYVYFNTVGIMAAEARARGFQERADAWDEISDFSATLADLVGSGVLVGVLAGVGLSAISPLIPAVAVGLAGFSLFADFVSVINASEATNVEWDNPQLAWEAACCVKDSLVGATITESAFKFAISDCFAVASGDFEFYMEMLNIWSTDTEPYLVFLKILAETVHIAIDGVELPCDCPICEFTDFRTELGSWTINPGHDAARVDTVGIVAPHPHPGDITEDNHSGASIALTAGTVLSRVTAHWRSPRNADTVGCNIAIVHSSGSTELLYDTDQLEDAEITTTWTGTYLVVAGDSLRVFCDASNVTDKQGILRDVEFCIT